MHERREHPRIDFLAQVQITRDDEVQILSTENISLGGLFLNADPYEYPGIHVGTDLDIMIFAADDIGFDLTCRARVVRVAGRATGQPGFGLQFTTIDEPSLQRLAEYIAHQERRQNGG
ncbi:MAG: PilZ domain-containing protein [Deltaproteobacteria bacterium]|nr:PilZ domain-containing protein [Deltaproteobacteria bacterium]